MTNAAAPVDDWVREWGRSLDDAADAWQPELRPLLDRLGISDGDRVLDAGCGSGRITGWLAERVEPTGEVLAVDVAGEALALARAAHATSVIRYAVGDIEALPFADRTFDAAWCSRVVGYLHQPDQALSELVRVTRPGGRVIVVAADAARGVFLPIDPDLELRIRQAMHRAWRAGAWGRPYDMHVGRRLYASAAALPVSRVTPVSLVWERWAPLSALDRRYLGAIHAWLTDPASRRWLGTDWGRCQELFGDRDPGRILDRPDLHVLMTATAVEITV